VSLSFEDVNVNIVRYERAIDEGVVLEYVSVVPPFKFSEGDRLATTFCPSAQALHVPPCAVHPASHPEAEVKLVHSKIKKFYGERFQ
jgi:hypothetical protein